jgi:hypothetical protein
VNQKELIAFLFIVLGIAGCTVATTLSKRARDLLFVGMILLAPMTELYDVNFMSRNFYRGTVRGFEFSLVDILAISVLLGTLLAPRREQTRAFWAPGLGVMLLFFLYCGFSIAISEPRLFGLFELLKMLRGLIIFLTVAFYLQSEREMRILLLALGLVICYEGMQALRQRYLWGVHRVFGTVDHSNSLSALLCLTAPVFVAAFNSRIPLWLKGLCAAALAFSCVGVILTISRAGVVIMALVLLGSVLATMSIRFNFKKVVIFSIVCVGVAGLVAKSWQTLVERFRESTLTEEYENRENQGRGYYLRLAEAIAAENFFGVGLNNWSWWVSNKYGPRQGYRFNPYKSTDIDPSYIIPKDVTNIDDPQAAPAHNLGALTVGELGLPGLVLFALVWARWLQMGFSFLWKRTPDPMRRIAVGIFFGLCGMWLQSLTEWVFRHSPIFYMCHILLGVLAGLYYLKRQERRAPTVAEAEDEASVEEAWPETGAISPKEA